MIRLAYIGNEPCSKPAAWDELYCANEVFLTGTTAEIIPVVERDHRPIGTGLPGPLTRRIQEAYFAAVQGQDSNHLDWLTW